MQTISDVPILLRREIEALILKPFLDAFEQELGKEKTLEIVRKVIRRLALKSGADYAAEHGNDGIPAIQRQMAQWNAGGALDEVVLACDEQHLEKDVTRCAFADMYKRIGMPELGQLLSCERDPSFYEAFTPQITFERSKTLMQGDDRCDFRFAVKE